MAFCSVFWGHLNVSLVSIDCTTLSLFCLSPFKNWCSHSIYLLWSDQLHVFMCHFPLCFRLFFIYIYFVVCVFFFCSSPLLLFTTFHSFPYTEILSPDIHDYRTPKMHSICIYVAIFNREKVRIWKCEEICDTRYDVCGERWVMRTHGSQVCSVHFVIEISMWFLLFR